MATESTLGVDSMLGVGFGMVQITLDGQIIWSGDDERVTLADLESISARYDNHEWRVFFDGPLGDALFQRQDDGRWILTRSGPGFMTDEDRGY